ncbi:MAG TPA: type I restriction enzyme HsdR N-terminal domain-containing protein [Nitrospirota bacterium]|nr:type I restriction enzyme HsdR N-terminal domain-containing protein [Nitrospirota bacterium]
MEETREEKIRQILAQEIQDGESLAAEARKMVAYLLQEKKGYASGDIRSGIAFEVGLGQETVWSSADFLVSADGRTGMLIKCAAGSLDSRQRQAVAAARVIASPPVPVAVVVDPVNAVVLDVATGKVIGEGFGAIPVKDQLRKILHESAMQPLSPERVEKEKRILLAFDAIQCSVPRGADGGVQIGPEAEKEEA